MSPTHFLDKADLYEIEAFLDGASKRERDDWERTRFEMMAVYNSVGAKLEKAQDVMPFPWDEKDEDEDPELVAKRMAALQQMARNHNAKLKDNG